MDWWSEVMRKIRMVVELHWGEGGGQNLFLNLVLGTALFLIGMKASSDRVQQYSRRS
jgi:hypothetical protein